MVNFNIQSKNYLEIISERSFSLQVHLLPHIFVVKGIGSYGYLYLLCQFQKKKWVFSSSKTFLKKALTCFTNSLVLVCLIMLLGCSNKKNVQLDCLANHIFANIEKEKIENFITLEGTDVWREGWGELTSDIAEDHYLVEECHIPQYLDKYNFDLIDVEGQMFFVYSMHSYLKHGKVNPETIHKKIDSLFFKE
jgi:hypothetical protein